MSYFSNIKHDLYQNPPSDSGNVDNKNIIYDPLDKTQVNPYLEVDNVQLENMYNIELDALEFASDKTRVDSPTPIQSYSGRLDAFVNRDNRDKPVTDKQLESVLGPGIEKQNFAKNFKEGGELKEEAPVTLDFLPSSLQSKHPDVYEKLMGMSGDNKQKLTDYFNATISSAQENVTDIKSGLGWFKDLDVDPVKDILESAGIEKGAFRDVVQDYAAEKAQGAGEDFGYGSQIALNTAMRLKGLKRGGLVKKYSGGGDLTQGQQTAVNWSNIASTAVNTGVALSEESAVFNKEGDPYSEASLKDTRKAAIGERAGKGASIGGTAGAAIGSIIPGVGTAVGAAVGTAVGALAGTVSGWFGGKKQYEKDQAAVEERKEAESVTNINLGNQISETLAEKSSLEAKEEYLDDINLSTLKYGGMVYGPRHEQGGVMAYKDGKPIAEVEGDEYVINNDIIKDKKESKQRFRVEGTPAQIASALNSYKGYGDNTNPGGNIYKIG